MEDNLESKEISSRIPFEITHLTSSLKGFSVTTDRQLKRREIYEPLNLPLEEKQQLSEDMKGDLKRALEIATGSSTFDRDKPLTENERMKYLDTIGAKIAIRNIRQNKDLLTVDVKPVSYHVYQDLSKQSEMTPEDIQELAGASGIAAALLTTEPDGTHKLIVQHRHPIKNKSYRDIPGASAAGLFDAKFDRNSQIEGVSEGKIEPINTKTIKQGIVNEMFQEVALNEEDLLSIRLVGIARDNVKVHDEFMFLGKSKLSSKEIEEKAAEAPRSKKLGDEYDFSEKFVLIDATPEAIAELLTEVKCPLPPTHAATFLAAGYLMILEDKGQDDAQLWYGQTESLCYQNYHDIDRLAVESGQGTGYDPKKLPSEQGLPDFEEEMQRVGLI